MTREERHALLGDDVIAHIDACVDAAPEPTPEVIASLRRIFTQPLGAAPAEDVRPSADAA